MILTPQVLLTSVPLVVAVRLAATITDWVRGWYPERVKTSEWLPGNAGQRCRAVPFATPSTVIPAPEGVEDTAIDPFVTGNPGGHRTKRDPDLLNSLHIL